MKIIFFKIILLTLLTNLVLAKPHIGIVTRVKGNATKLLPGALQASKIVKGDKLFEDTSVVTGNRSFVKVLFVDKTKLSIGPRSKVVINQIEKKSGSVLSLLKGKIRSKVEKETEKKNKFYIKTRTAALGVRGTDFQTIYNPDNKVTNLVTFNGEVAMAKAKFKMKDPVVEELQVERKAGKKIKYKKVLKSKNVAESIKIEDALESKDTVVVKPGQYAGTTGALKKASKPVKISPVQLGLLYSNEEMQEKESSGDINAKNASDIKSFTTLSQAEQNVPHEGFYDEKTGDYAPKSGGFIDLETGLYIAPEKDAIYDEQKKIYVPKVAGQLDEETGQYIAPKGLKLDAKEGFVLRGRYKDPKKQEVLLAAQSGLNFELNRTLLAKEEVIDDFQIYSLRELYSKDIVTFSLKPHSQDVDIENDNGSKSRYDFDGPKEVAFSWMMAGNGTYRPIFGFHSKSSNYENENSFNKEGSKLYGMKVGIHRYLTSRWSLVSQIEMEEDSIPDGFDSDNFKTNLERVTLTKIGVGVKGIFATYKKSYFGLDALIKSNLNKKDSNITVKNGFGYLWSLNIGYWMKRHHLLELSLYNENHSADVNGSDNDFTYSMSEGGTQFSYSYIF